MAAGERLAQPADTGVDGAL
jgi:hypothetical protein